MKLGKSVDEKVEIMPQILGVSNFCVYPTLLVKIALIANRVFFSKESIDSE